MKTFTFRGGPLDGQRLKVSLSTFNEHVKCFLRKPRTGTPAQPTYRHKEAGELFFYRCPCDEIGPDNLPFDFTARLNLDGLLFVDEIVAKPKKKSRAA